MSDATDPGDRSSTDNGEAQPRDASEVRSSREREARLDQHTTQGGEPSGTTRTGGESELDADG